MSYSHLVFDAAVVLVAGAINVRIYILLWDLRWQTKRFLRMTCSTFSPEWAQGKAWAELAATVQLDISKSLTNKKAWRQP